MNRKRIVNWQSIYVLVILIVLLAVFVVSGYEGANIAISNNLDRYIPMYKVLKDHHAFFSQDKVVPIYGFIGRDFLPSELKIQTMLYWLFPTYIAYLVSIFLKIAVGILGVNLWFKSLSQEKWEDVRGISLIMGLAYGLLNVIPYYGLAYASIPLLLFFLSEFIKKRNWKYGIALLIYPVFSEFQSFGVIILVALLLSSFMALLRKQKNGWSGFIAFIVLTLGYAWSEYRFIRLIFYRAISVKSVWASVLLWKKENILSDLIMVIGIFGLYVFYMLIIKEFDETSKRDKVLGNLIGIVATILILCMNTTYNDFLHTFLPSKEAVSYKDYYSEAFINDIKNQLHYYDQYTYSYGMDSAILIYNGIRDMEGYTSTIPDGEDRYKEDLEAIAIGTESFDADKLKEENGRFIFSNRELQASEMKGLDYVDTFDKAEGDESIFVYRTSSRYKQKEHLDTIYEDRANLSYNREEFETIAAQIKTLVEDENTTEYELVETLYKQMFAILQDVQTVYSMKDIDSKQDVTNLERMDKTSKIYEEYLSMHDLAFQTLRDMCKTSYRKVLEEDYTDTEIEVLVDYEDMTEEDKARKVKLNELTEQYEQAAYEEYPVEYNGESWTMDQLNEEADNLEPNEGAAIYNALYKKRGDVLGKIYLEIRDIQNEIAEDEGYKNYMEYAYEGVYARDYSIRDVKKLFKELKKKGKTDYAVVMQMGQKLAEYNPGFFTEDDTKTFELLYPHISAIDPELGTSMKHLLDCKLYNLKKSDTKAAMGYTTSLGTYGDAFIFDAPYGQVNDFFTYVHEFGHFNAAYYTKADPIFGEGSILDVCEIQSQGLEMLMAPKYAEFFDENEAAYLEYTAVENLLYAVYSAACKAEFEIYAYEHPDCTLDELGEEYRKLYLQYGFGVPMGSKQLNSWVDISHFFESPGYYISYATSAFGALQLYQMAKVDYAQAVEKYMEISAIDSFTQYCQAMNSVNMENPFDKNVAGKVIEDVCDDLKTMLKAYN